MHGAEERDDSSVEDGDNSYGGLLTVWPGWEGDDSSSDVGDDSSPWCDVWSPECDAGSAPLSFFWQAK